MPATWPLGTAARDGELVHYVTELGGWVQALAVSDDGTRVAAGSGGSTIHVFDVKDNGYYAEARRSALALRRAAQPILDRAL